MNLINYSALAAASTYYEENGFNRIEVPWWVTEDISNVTKPPDATSYKIDRNGKTLLASGEQGFLYLALKGQLAPGKYQTITPCFREEQYDQQHSKQFMKLELITILDQRKLLGCNDINKEVAFDIMEMINVAEMGHLIALGQVVTRPSKTVTLKKLPIKKVALSSSFDLEINGVEVGSYGYRSSSFCHWIYGTGLAEPRFSRTVMDYMLTSA